MYGYSKNAPFSPVCCIVKLMKVCKNMDSKHAGVKLRIPEIYMNLRKQREQFTLHVQARLCQTLISNQRADYYDPDGKRIGNSGDAPWPNAPWHFRVLARQLQARERGHGLVAVPLNYRPWFTGQFPKRSNQEMSPTPLFVNLFTDVYKLLSQTSKIWEATRVEILQETIEDVLLSQCGQRRKFAHWKDFWVSKCAAANAVTPVWNTTFDKLYDLYDGPGVEVPNAWALSRPSLRRLE